MKKRSKILAAVMAMTLVAGTLMGCGGGEDKKSSDAKGKGGEQVLNISTGSVVVGLNPLLNTTAPDNAAHNMLCESLVRSRTAPEHKNEIVPGAAEKWDVSEDGCTYTFHMRKDMKWSDGTPLTAKDFEYTFKKMADPKVAATSAWLFEGLIENFSEALYDGKSPDNIGVKALDDETLEIKLVYPASYALDLFASAYPVPEAKYEELGEKYGTTVENTLYSGPFKIESWNENTEMVLIPNEYHFAAKEMKLKKINYKVISEAATSVQAFLNGELDIISTSDVNWADKIKQSGMAKEDTVPDNAPEFYMFNLKNEYLSNTKIRQALSLSFDREAMVKSLRHGNALPCYSLATDLMKIGDKTFKEMIGDEADRIKVLQKENPDPKKLFQEGLAELGKDTDTSKVTIRYASRGTTEFSKKLAEWLKQEWETKLGIKVEIDMMEWNIMWDKIDAGDYDIACAGWGPYYNEPSAFYQLFDYEKGYFNAAKTGWNNDDAKKLSEILEEAKAEVDENKKAQLYLEAEKLLVENAVIAPSYIDVTPEFVSNNVEGYNSGSVGMVDYTQISVNK